MIRCHHCNNRNLNGAEFCDECGVRLDPRSGRNTGPPPSPSFLRDDLKPVPVRPISPIGKLFEEAEAHPNAVARLVLILKGHSPREFLVNGAETLIGRWDATTGVFPDIDLEPADDETKVSRRHARIVRKDGQYWIEDLGSLNGTIINRRHRLSKGQPYLLKDGDEIIVGKSFLKFSYR